MAKMPVLCVLLGWGLLATTALGQPPHVGEISPEKYTIKMTRNQMVSMRDGVRLAADTVQPAEAGKYPGLLMITPYSNNSVLGERAKWFAARGYLVVLVDMRGRFDSDGEWDPFDARHKTDGYDLVEWLAKQPECTGSVGMYGLSFMGWTQWWTATQAPPSLKAIVPEVAPPDQFLNCPYQQGILVSWMADFGSFAAGRTLQKVGPGNYGGFLDTRLDDYMHTPYVDLNKRRGTFNAPWYERWIRENLSTSDYWRAIAYQTPESYARVTVPSLNVTGWFDADFPGAPSNYIAMKKHGGSAEARRPRLVIGPWEHLFNRQQTMLGIDYGPDSIIDWDGYVCKWLDHYLKNVDNGVENDPPVYVFVMGVNRWYAEQDWPLPQTQWTKFYLHSAGHANTRDGDGTLSLLAPTEEPADEYTYDPAKPTLCTFANGHIDGATDTRASNGGDEVLVYTTPPLAEAVEVTGPVTAKLFAATTARDTDWMMRLVDVYPDGRSALLCDGVIRARCRDPQREGGYTSERLSTIEPDKVYEYTLEFWRGTGNVFLPGHRIRVEISSSYYPYYFRNLNTGADNVGLETSSVVAQQRIEHNAAHPSHIVLPVIPARP